jgi:ATP-dependent Zn protease
MASPDDPDTLEATAYHEAGHAVAAYLQELAFTEVHIIADLKKGYLGKCEQSLCCCDRMRRTTKQ